MALTPWYTLNHVIKTQKFRREEISAKIFAEIFSAEFFFAEIFSAEFFLAEIGSFAEILWGTVKSHL